jgi:teichuronic acid biosynthesis glycosyltransferase TuaC
MAGMLEARAVGPGPIGASEKERPLRVLAVTPLPSSKASMIHVTRQVASLEGSGVTCQTFHVTSRTSPSVVLGEWRRLRREIRMFQPDIVHAHYGTMTAFLAILSTTLPVMITYRGSDLNPNRSRGWLRDVVGTLLSQIAALRAARIICVSNQLKDKLWWRRDRVSIIPTGVDMTLFYPRDLQEARLELGWAQHERVVLFNAGDPVCKRLDLARAAVQFAEALCGTIRFAVLDGNVPPNHIPSMMNAADCLLLTSDWEGSPNVVKEALACNLPVVSVDVGDVRERLERVWPSVIVPRDACEIGKAISGILKQGRRSNGRELGHDLSSEAVSQRIISVYKALQMDSPKSDSRFVARPSHQSFLKRSRTIVE